MKGKFGDNQWKIAVFYIVSIALAVLVLVIGGSFLLPEIKSRYSDYQKAQAEQEKIKEKEAEAASLEAAQEKEEKKAEEAAAKKAEETAAKKAEEAAAKEKKAKNEKKYVSEYELVVSDADWVQAKQQAEDMGGHLAVITSKKEQKAVEDLIDQDDSIHTVWLGGYTKKDGSFRWVNKEKFKYTNWGPGEPNNQTGDEDYLDMYEVDGVWCWNDVPNSIHQYYSGHMGYVIEWEVEQ